MTVTIERRDAPIVTERTALLIIDAQKGICTPRGGEDYFFEVMHKRVIPNIQLLLQSARTADLEIVYTVIESLTADGRDRSLDYKLSGFHFPPGRQEAQVIDALKPGPDEIVFPKTSSSLFNSTNFEYVMRNLGIESILVTGFQTDQCVDHTVRDGADRGFRMVCVTDACATKTAERHAAAIDAFGGYCRKATTDELLREIGVGAPQRRRAHLREA
jgi:nicotinamidase-related amidase